MGYIFAATMDKELAPSPPAPPSPPHPHPDPRHDLMKHGAEFAQGFFKGSKVGEFQTTDLYHCLEKEHMADKLFFEADMEMKKAFHEKNPMEGIKSLDTFVEFIVDMAREHTEKGENGEPVPLCKVVDAKTSNWKDVVEMIKLLKDPKTTLQVNKEGKFMFNG